MLIKATRKRPRKIAVAFGLIMMLVLASVGYGYAARRVQRPIAATGGKINQTYLWAENGHRGVDFPYNLGTDVYAVANGRVVDLEESLQNEEEVSDWGNFVLIQNNLRHYDRTTGQIAYDYYLYLHLSQNSVRVNEGDWVNAGDWIAEVDDTGRWSSGHHLHLQIVIHPQANRTIDTLDSENKSRNPELWLTPFNYSGDQTGTVIGKVTNPSATPVANLRIYGIEKPTAAGGNDYEWSQTYSYDWANPDDILVENFGTTDVAPGTYHIEAKYYSGGQWILYRDLGWHTVEAGKTTYVGLYPAYLPDVKVNSSGWSSTIPVRNDSTTHSAEVNTTFRYITGLTYHQRTDNLSPQSSISFTPPDPLGSGFNGSAVVAASQDVSMVVENYRSSNGQTYSYNGMAAGDARNPGWGETGTNIHLPLLQNNNSGWSTLVTILNTSLDWASIDLDYFAQGTGASWQGPTTNLNPGGTITYNQSGSSCPTVGAGRITSNQPLAVTVEQFHSSGVSSAYNGFSGGASTVNLPLIMANNSSWFTAFAVQNLGSARTTVTVYYDPQPGYAYRYPETATVDPHRTAIFAQWGGQWGTALWVGSARILAIQPIAAIVNQNNAGANSLLTYGSFLDGTSLSILPRVVNNYNGWTSGVQVQNLDSTTANLVLKVNGTQTWSGSIGAFKSVTLLPVPGTSSGFTGSAVVECTNGKRIAAIVNNTASTTIGDYARSYNGLSR